MVNQFHIIAFTHRNFDVNKIGKLHIDADSQKDRLAHLKESLDLSEIMFLSTCNRVEFLFCTDCVVNTELIARFFFTLYPDLHIDDIEHLEKLYSALNIFRLPRTDNKLQRCRFAISCKHIKDTLIEKGCVPNKSYVLKFPDENIFKSKDLIRHFIRGYFDGDG